MGLGELAFKEWLAEWVEALCLCSCYGIGRTGLQRMAGLVGRSLVFISCQGI